MADNEKPKIENRYANIKNVGVLLKERYTIDYL